MANLQVQNLIEIRKIANDISMLKTELLARHYRYTNPFPFCPQYSEDNESFVVLLFYNGVYYDYKGRDKGRLYDLIKPDITREHFLKGVKPQDLPEKLKDYGVAVAIGAYISTGDILTTLGHIISPQDYTIRLYRSRISNEITLIHEGQKIKLNLGKLIMRIFVKHLPIKDFRVFYIDNDFTNNRIENLQLLEEPEGEQNE